jgi:DNA-binding Lrp family transcriptional regulator
LAQQQKIYDNNKTINETVLEIIKQNGRATFGDLMIRLPDSIGAQDVWNSLRTLQEAEIVTPIKISNRKSSWKINK